VVLLALVVQRDLPVRPVLQARWLRYRPSVPQALLVPLALLLLKALLVPLARLVLSAPSRSRR